MVETLLATEVCITCGITYGLPARLLEQHRKDGGYHHCPNGHQQGFSKEGSETERLRRERDRLTQRLAQKDDEIAAERRLTQAEREAKAKVERKLKRVQKGVCPCCTRSFTNLARHMQTKHPNAAKRPALKVVNLP